MVLSIQKYYTMISTSLNPNQPILRESTKEIEADILLDHS